MGLKAIFAADAFEVLTEDHVEIGEDGGVGAWVEEIHARRDLA